MVMTCMAKLSLESASESMDSEYFLGLSPLGALSEARVIKGSCLGWFCSLGRVDAEVEDAAERALALLRVMMPEVTPPMVITFLFLALAARTT
ncbi:hypothetical protein ACFX19_017811 [Malus domestica]